MPTVTVKKGELSKVLSDVEVLISDMEDLFDQDSIAEHRLAEIKEKPSMGRTEEELDAYLKERGVKIE